MKYSERHGCYVDYRTRPDGKVDVWAQKTHAQLGITTTIYEGTYKEREVSSEHVRVWVIIDSFKPRRPKK